MSSITLISASSDSLTVQVSNLPDGAYYVRFYIGTDTSSMPYQGYVNVSDTAYAVYSFSGLTENTTYGVKISVRDSSQAAIEDPVTAWFSTSVAGRPEDWYWYSTVTKGATIQYTQSGTTITCMPLTASEWNGFVDRIYEFLEYKGVSTSVSPSDLYVTRGTKMTAATVDTAWDLIDTLNPPIGLPASATSGGGITAAYINGLKNSLNSIS